MRFIRIVLLALLVSAILALAIRWWMTTRSSSEYEVVATLVHPSEVFTEGLFWQGDTIIESSGLYGKSFVRQYDPASGVVVRQMQLADTVFAEGISIVANELFLLTWREGSILVFDAVSWQAKRRMPLAAEGWGLTTDGTSLIASDGSDTLTWYSPQDGTVLRTVRASSAMRSIGRLNELEWVDGKIWANVWPTASIAIIDPVSGVVNTFIDLDKLVPRAVGVDVLNGIAFHHGRRTVLVTGKRWPAMYEIRLQ